MKAEIRKNMGIMEWKECESAFIRKVEADEERIKSLVKKAMQRLDRARKTEIGLDNVSFVVEDYYEVIKELLIAYMLKDGLRSKNHQCLISYFYRKNQDYEIEANLMAQMSFFRNRLEYYGEDTPMSFYEKNKENFEAIITIIKDLLDAPKGMERKILEVIAANDKADIPDIAKAAGSDEKTIKSEIEKLLASKKLKRLCPDNGGHWEVT